RPTMPSTRINASLMVEAPEAWISSAVITLTPSGSDCSGSANRVAVTTVSLSAGACAKAHGDAAASARVSAVARGELRRTFMMGADMSIPGPASPPVQWASRPRVFTAQPTVVGRYPGWRVDFHRLPRRAVQTRPVASNDESGISWEIHPLTVAGAAQV